MGCRNRTRLLLSVLVLSSAFCMTGCLDSVDDVRIVIPDKIREKIMPEELSESSKETAVRLYFNNTSETKGFFDRKLLLTSQGYERGTAYKSTVYDENYTCNTQAFMNALESSFINTNSVEYTVEYYKIGNSFCWEKEEGDTQIFRNAMETDEFFLYDSQPLSSVMPTLLDFCGDDEDEERLNIYLTSFAELAEYKSDLCEWVQKELKMEKGADNRSACIVGMRCDYNGAIVTPEKNTEAEIQIDETGGVVRTKNKEITGTRILYLLITGERDRLETYVHSLEKALKNESFEAGTDYELYYFPEKQFSALEDPLEMIRIAPAAEEEFPTANTSQEEMLLAMGVFNSAMNVEHVDPMEAAEFFEFENGEQIQQDTLLHTFAYEDILTDSSFGTNRMTLNFYVPLKDFNTGGNPDGIYDVEIHLDETDGKENVMFYYSSYDELEFEEEEEEEEEDDEEETVARIRTDAISYYEFRRCGFEVQYQVISGGEIPAFDKNSIPVESEDEAIEDEDIEKIMTLDTSHDWIQVTVDMKIEDVDSDKTGVLFINIPIYGVIYSGMADWLENCSYSYTEYRNALSGSSGSSLSMEEIYARTYSIEEFVRTLAGMDDEAERKFYASMYETVITDITVCITGFPANW